MQLIILAGGFGTRLSAHSGGVQKCMTLVNGIPLLEHQIRMSVAQGITEIYLLLHYDSKSVINYFGNGKKIGANINYVEESFPSGNGGALANAKSYFHENFLILYGDVYLNVNLKKLYRFHLENKADLTLFTHPNSHPYDSDLVEVDGDSKVTSLCSPPHVEDYTNLVNAGLYAASKNIFEGIGVSQGEKIDFARNLIPRYIKEGKKVFSYRSIEYIKDMGTPDRLEKVLKDISNNVPEKLKDQKPKKVIFLDRDGTLNPDPGYIKNKSEFNFYPDVATQIRKINEDGTLCVLVTNQPVIARGQASEQQLRDIHKKMETLAGNEGAYFDGIFYCPHHPDRGYDGEIKDLKIECTCRKPKTGLLNKADELFLLDKGTSWIIGDSAADIGAGKNFGIKTILIQQGKPNIDALEKEFPDYIFSDFGKAIDWALNGYDVFFKYIESKLINKFLEKKIIVVGGLSHVGKTTFSNVLKDVLQLKSKNKAHILSLDSFLYPQKNRKHINDVNDRYDIDNINKSLNEILSHKEISIPFYSKLTGNLTSIYQKIKMEEGDFLIVEGVIGLMLDISNSYKIYYSQDYIARDLRIKDHYKKRLKIYSRLNDLDFLKMDAEKDKILKTAKYADICVNYDNNKNSFTN